MKLRTYVVFFYSDGVAEASVSVMVKPNRQIDEAKQTFNIDRSFGSFTVLSLVHSPSRIASNNRHPRD